MLTPLGPKQTKSEYVDGTQSLREVLRQHLAFCLFFDFDQIRHTDLVTVHCVKCGNAFKVPFDDLATRALCDDCKDEAMTMDEFRQHRKNLNAILQRLINTNI